MLIFVPDKRLSLGILIQIFNSQLQSFALKRHVNKHILDKAFFGILNRRRQKATAVTRRIFELCHWSRAGLHYFHLVKHDVGKK